MRMLGRGPWLVVGLIALALMIGGCGSSGSSASSGGGSSPPPAHIHFAKTKFVFHAGLAFGAFHRYLYKPLRAGAFSSPLSHKVALVKAALATAFIVHELKIAFADAQSSPTLSKLVSPITAVKDKLASMVAGFKSGHYDPAQINSAQSGVKSIGAQSAGAGAPVKDLPVPSF